MKRPGQNIRAVADELELSKKDRETLKQLAVQYVQRVYQDDPGTVREQFQDRATDYASKFVQHIGSKLFYPGQARYKLPEDRQIIVSLIAPYLIRVHYYDIIERPSERRRTKTPRKLDGNETVRIAKRICTSDVQSDDEEDTIMVVQAEGFLWSTASEASEDEHHESSLAEKRVATQSNIHSDDLNQQQSQNNHSRQSQEDVNQSISNRTRMTETPQTSNSQGVGTLETEARTEAARESTVEDVEVERDRLNEEEEVKPPEDNQKIVFNFGLGIGDVEIPAHKMERFTCMILEELQDHTTCLLEYGSDTDTKRAAMEIKNCLAKIAVRARRRYGI